LRLGKHIGNNLVRLRGPAFGHDPAQFHLTLTDENGEVSRRDVSEAELEKIMSSSAGEAQVARMSDQETHDAFRLIRWTDTSRQRP
jgi:hypothetical protein